MSDSGTTKSDMQLSVGNFENLKDDNCQFPKS